MLVYMKQDMACTSIDGYRVYGKKFAYGSLGPTNVPVEVYNKHKAILMQAEYTNLMLEKRFGKPFPDVSYDFSKLKDLDMKVLVKIAHCIGINYIKSRWHTAKQKRALIRSIKKMISEV